MINIKHLYKLFNLLEINKRSFIRKHTLYFIIIISYSLCSIVYPSFVHFIIDDGVIADNKNIIIINCILMVITGVMIVVSDYYLKLFYNKFDISFAIDMKTKLFEHIIHSNNNFSSDKRVGDLCTSLNSDLGSISTLLTKEIPNIVKNLITFVGVACFVVFYFRGYGLIIIILALFSVLFQNKFGNKIMEISERLRMYIGEQVSFETEVLMNLEEIQMSGYRGQVFQKFIHNNDKTKQANIQNSRILFLSYSLGYFMNTLIMLLILVFGAFKSLSGELEVGMLFSLTIYAQRLINPIGALVTSYIETKNVYPLVIKTEKLLKDIIVINKEKMLIPTEELNEITFKNISYQYPKSQRLIFQNFNLNVSKGDIIGIVGHNGTGKSTLIKLLFKLCEADHGEILINQKYNLNQLDIEYLHKHIGYVGQDGFLFSGKLKDVINPKGLELKQEEILEVIDNLNLNVDLFNETLDFSLSENSANVSGGERQKLTLARMIMEDKPWIILDEPTSSMDMESEKIICEYLEKLCRDKTALIITHREEILSLCNKIIDLNNIKLM